MLDIAKIEAGKIEPRPQPVDLPDLLKSCADLVQQPIDQRDLKFNVDVAGDLPAIVADPQHLRQILLNLLSNAVKFTLSGGEITLGATRKVANDEECIEIWVSDTGIGIAPNDITKALSPFGQVRTNVTTAHKGTGLGLPITKSLTELNGGRFEIESAIGKGTRVSIHFPRAKIAGKKLAA